MKTQTETKPQFSSLFKMNQAHFYSKLLETAVELKIFNHLEQENTPENVATQMTTHPENTGYFLNGLATMGLLKKKNKKYTNTDISQKYLVKGSDTYLGDYLLNHLQWNTPFFENIIQIIKNGPPKQETKVDDEAVWTRGAMAMVNYQRVCTGPVLTDIISKLPEFESFKHMLDLGGGPGLNTQAILNAHPNLQATLFDRASVVEVARNFIQKYKMEKRMAVMGGDFQTDSLGQGYDLILASACLNFAKDQMSSIVKKIFKSLNPGGVFVSIHDGLTHEGTQPESIALSWLPVSTMWQDLSLDKGFIAHAMVEAGFKSVSSSSVCLGIGIMDLDIARKA